MTNSERPTIVTHIDHDPTPDDDNEVVLDFADFLNNLDHGRVATEAGDLLREVIDAVKTTGKAGHLTIKIGVGWDRKADMLRVSNTLTSKAPQRDRAESLFFVTDDGIPTRQDPRQLALELENKRRMDAAGNVVDFTEPRHRTNP